MGMNVQRPDETVPSRLYISALGRLGLTVVWVRRTSRRRATETEDHLIAKAKTAE